MAQLVIPSQETSQTFTVTSSQSVFPISFALFSKADLNVLVGGFALMQSEFTFSGTLLDGGGYQGGTVTLNVAVASTTVEIERRVVIARAENYAPANFVPVRTVDMALNRQMAISQDLARRTDLANSTSIAALATAEEMATAAFVTALDISTRDRVELVSIPAWVRAINLAGFADADDGGGGLYVRADSEPAHAGKVQSADGAWWELAAGHAALEMFGGAADNDTDNYQPWRDAIYWAYLKGKQMVLTRTGGYRFLRRVGESPCKIEYPADIVFANPAVKMIVENGNDAEGVFILSSDVSIRGGEIRADSDSSIINGSGHCGTCITISQWFVDPNLPEPPLVKNIVIRDMKLTRGMNFGGHAISVLARTSHVLIENIDFIGNSATSSGSHGDAVLTHWGAWSHGVSTTGIDYDAQTAAYTPGATVTGGTSGATAYIVVDEDSGATGRLYLKSVSGTFQDGELLTDNEGGSATAASGPTTDLRQSRFEPEHYSFHPNNVRIRNVRCRNVGRFIACSASYSIDVDGVDFLGPVQGSQLVDLPVGDEADTFAHPDDRGRVYDGFNMRNIRASFLTGTGVNAQTAIDCSGYSTSKQTDADLAGYADSAYDDSAYGGQTYSRWRQPEWKNVVLEGFTFDFGPADPPSATVINRVIWIRNVRGNFTFRDFWVEARENADRSGTPDPVIAAIELANNQGNFTFDRCKFAGHLVLDSTDTVSFSDGAFKHREIVSGTAAVLMTGAQPTLTTDTSTHAVGATELTLNAAVTGTNIRIGDLLSYAGGVVYAGEFVLGGSGQTTLKVTPGLPTAATAGTVFTIDHRNRASTFRNMIVKGGSRGFDISDSIGVTIEGGEINDSGQYGLITGSGCQVDQAGTLFNNGGQRRATIPADSGLATRDVILNGGNYVGRRLRFSNSTFISVNFVVGSAATHASLTDSVFAGSPITAKVQVAALSNGKPVQFARNSDNSGAAVFLSGSWTPALAFGGASAGLTYSSQVGSYTVMEDRVLFDADLVLSGKGSSTGNAQITGAPFTQATGAGTAPANGATVLSGMTGLTGAGQFNMSSGTLTLIQSAAAGQAAITDANFTDTSRVRLSGVYRRAA